MWMLFMGFACFLHLSLLPVHSIGGKVSILMAFLCPSYTIIGRILDFKRNPFAEILFKEDIYCLMTMVRTILFKFLFDYFFWISFCDLFSC